MAESRHMDLSLDRNIPIHSSQPQVVIYQAPRYIPNSGPPLLSPTLLPPHDRDGVILKYVPGTEDLIPFYIVGYDQEPDFTVVVRPHKILEWVSSRTLEDFEYERALQTEKEEEEERVRQMQAKEERLARRQKRMNELLARTGAKPSSISTGSKKRGRPLGWRKYPLASAANAEPAKVQDAPSQGPHSALSTPSNKRTRGLAEPVVIDSDSDEDELALDAQFLDNMTSRDELSDDSGAGLVSQGPIFRQRSRERDAGAETIRKKIAYVQLKRNNSPRSTPLKSKATNARIKDSSQTMGPRSRQHSEQITDLSQNENTKKPRETQSREPPDSKMGGVGDSDEEDEPEWEIEGLIGDKWEHNDTGRVRYFLVKWKGNYDPTWEPEHHIDDNMRIAYLERRARDKHKQAGRAGSAQRSH